MMNRRKKARAILFNSSVAAMTGILLLTPHAALAEGIGDTKLVTGLTRLINDASTALMALAIPVAGLTAAFFLIRRAGADQQDQKQWGDRAKAAVICGIGAIVVGGVIKALATYFQ